MICVKKNYILLLTQTLENDIILIAANKTHAEVSELADEQD